MGVSVRRGDGVDWSCFPIMFSMGGSLRDKHYGFPTTGTIIYSIFSSHPLCSLIASLPLLLANVNQQKHLSLG